MDKLLARTALVAGAVAALVLATITPAFADDPNPASTSASAPPTSSTTSTTAPAPAPAVAAVAPPVARAAASATPTTTVTAETTMTPTVATEVAAASALPPIAVAPHLDPPQPPPPPSGLPLRIGSGFAATPDGTQAVLYGGSAFEDDAPGKGTGTGSATGSGDTWVWNGTTWTPKCGTTTSGATAPCTPGPRFLVGEGTGPTGVVLYGGETGNGEDSTSLADSYVWNGSTWQEICDACPPGARAAPAMAGNGATVLLFGGGATGDGGGGTALGDTWQFDGSAWTQVNAGGPGQPVARLGGSMAWDGQHFVLFGGIVPGDGSGNPAPLGDTWIWMGSQWVQACGKPLAACAPAPRLLGGFAHLANPDPALQGALLVGGLQFNNGDSGGNVLGDIWFWNGSTWIKQASPWPDAAPISDGFPSGLPFAGALAALPASCQVSLTADFVTDSGRSPTATPGTWNIGFDANGDGQPDPCPATPPATTAAVPVSEFDTPAAAGELPRTGRSLERDAAFGGILLLTGLALVCASQRRARSAATRRS